MLSDGGLVVRILSSISFHCYCFSPDSLFRTRNKYISNVIVGVFEYIYCLRLFCVFGIFIFFDFVYEKNNINFNLTTLIHRLMLFGAVFNGPLSLLRRPKQKGALSIKCGSEWYCYIKRAYLYTSHTCHV